MHGPERMVGALHTFIDADAGERNAQYAGEWNMQQHIQATIVQISSIECTPPHSRTRLPRLCCTSCIPCSCMLCTEWRAYYIVVSPSTSACDCVKVHLACVLESDLRGRTSILQPLCAGAAVEFVQLTQNQIENLIYSTVVYSISVYRRIRY